MKQLLTIIGLAGVLTMPVFAQVTVTTDPNTNAVDNTQIKTDLLTFGQSVETNGALDVSIYPMYAPSITVNGKKDTFGMGVAAVVPGDIFNSLQGTFAGQHMFGGLRFDYLAHQAFASTIGVGVKEDIAIKGHEIYLFTHAGANIPFSGFGQNNVNVGGMIGGGFFTTIWQPTTNLTFNVQLSAEKWTQFPAFVLLGGPDVHWSFK